MPLDQRVLDVRLIRTRFSWRLFHWANFSIFTGGVMLVLAGHLGVAGSRFPLSPLAFAIGLQFVIWGAIDLLFAAAGIKQSRLVEGASVATADPESEMRDAQRLVTILRFNARFLNPVWIASGVVIAAVSVYFQSPALLGHGIGVIVQGGFLYLYDRNFESALVGATVPAAGRSGASA